MQGMCDLVAPLLVMMKEEASAHALFAKLMDRAKDNFPTGSAMDAHFADMRFVPVVYLPDYDNAKGRL